MLTSVDNAEIGGLWLSISALAAERGVSRAAVSQNLQRWAERGAPVATRNSGREVLVNVAEYDMRRGEVADLGHIQAEETRSGAGDPIFSREQARKLSYEAELRRIELDQKLGRLVEAADLQQAAIDCGAAQASRIDQIAMRAEEVYSAAQADGLAGVRAVLKVIARDLRGAIAEELARLAAARPSGENTGT